MKQPIDSHPKSYPLVFVTVTLVMVTVMLFWDANVRYRDFGAYQQQLMENSVLGEVNEIGDMIEGLQSQVSLFAEEQYDLINYLAAYPDDEDVRTYLEKKVARQFPEYFAITITDEAGTPLFANFDLLVNEICQADIRQYIADGYRYKPYVHPHSDAYHFDVMSTWGSNDKVRGVFFISFRPQLIANALRNSQIPGHKLMLLRSDVPGLVEIASEGARIDIPDLANTFKLDDSIMSRIGSRKAIDNTRWEMVVVPDPAIFTRLEKDILFQALATFAGFSLVALTMLAFVRHGEKNRRLSEEQLASTKQSLQKTLDFSDVGIWEWDIPEDRIEWSKNIMPVFGGKTPLSLAAYRNIVHHADRFLFDRTIDESKSLGQTFRTEHRIVLPGGAVRWVNMGGDFLFGEEGQPHKLLGLIRDTSNRKRLEEERLASEKAHMETLIREVHHRIKNNLQGVIGLLTQHSSHHPEYKAIIDRAVSQLHSVSLVHGLQSDGTLSDIKTEELLQAIRRAAANLTGIRARLDTAPRCDDSTVLENERAVPVALIMNELLINAIKHSSDPAGVNIMLDCPQDGHCIIRFSNSGQCLPDDFSFADGSGLGTGLTLIRSLLPREGARLHFKNNSDGVTATLELFPPVIRSTAQHDNVQRLA